MHPKLCSPTTSRLFQGFFFFFQLLKASLRKGEKSLLATYCGTKPASRVWGFSRPHDQEDAHFVALNGTQALVSHSVNTWEVLGRNSSKAFTPRQRSWQKTQTPPGRNRKDTQGKGLLRICNLALETWKRNCAAQPRNCKKTLSKLNPAHLHAGSARLWPMPKLANLKLIQKSLFCCKCFVNSPQGPLVLCLKHGTHKQ